MFRCLIRLQLIQLVFTRMVWISLSFVVRTSNRRRRAVGRPAGWRRRRRSHIHTIEYFVSRCIEQAFVVRIWPFSLFSFSCGIVSMATAAATTMEILSIRCRCRKRATRRSQTPICMMSARVNGKHREANRRVYVVMYICESLFYSHSSNRATWIYSVWGAAA